MFSVRTLLCNLAQILLVFFLFPILGLICDLLQGNSAVTAIIGFIGNISLCNTIADVLSQYAGRPDTGELVNVTVWTFLKEFPSAFIAGMCVDTSISIFNLMWDPIKKKDSTFKPLPILPGFLGIFAFTLIINLIGLSGNDLVAFFMQFAVIAIMILGIKFMITLKKMSTVFSLKKVLLWVIEGVYAIILSTYITGMAMIAVDKEPIAVFPFILWLAGSTVFASILVVFVRAALRKDGI